MNALLVHGFGRPAALPGNGLLDWETVTWRPEAQVLFPGLDDPSDLAPLIAGGARRH